MVLMQRLWQIDAARGFAVAAMIVYNYFFTLQILKLYDIGAGLLGWMFWVVFPRIIGGTFIFIAGLSLALSYSKRKNAFLPHQRIRGGKIFALGLLITGITWLAVPSSTIHFGILHVIGLSILLSLPLFRSSSLRLLAIGTIVIAVGVLLQTFRVEYFWLLWLGLMPQNYITLDYWPFLPWFGVMLLGLASGKVIFRKRKKKVSAAPSAILPICFVGRHSLSIYLLHQPLFLLILLAIGVPVLGLLR